MLGDRNSRIKPRDRERELRERLREVYEAWIKPVEDYPFPLVTLSERTEMDAVCTIFETLNRRGVKLTVFELLTARFWSKGENLRDRWARACDEYPDLGPEGFEVDPYYILQAIALMAEDRAPSCKRRDVLQLKPEEVTERWPAAVDGLAEGLEILRSECGIVIRDLLPYETMLYPLAAVWARGRQAKGAQHGASRDRLVRWFWCSVFGQAYENSPNSQASKDVGELRRVMDASKACGRDDPQRDVLQRFGQREGALGGIRGLLIVAHVPELVRQVAQDARQPRFPGGPSAPAASGCEY